MGNMTMVMEVVGTIVEEIALVDVWYVSCPF